MAETTSDQRVCAQCAEPFDSKFKDQKRCKVCQTANNLAYIGTKESKCPICDQAFCARKRGRTNMCGYCEETIKRPTGAVRGTCGLSGQEDVWLLHDTVRIRIGVTTDPAWRPKVIRATAKKSLRQAQANGTTEAPRPPAPA